MGAIKMVPWTFLSLQGTPFVFMLTRFKLCWACMLQTSLNSLPPNPTNTTHIWIVFKKFPDRKLTQWFQYLLYALLHCVTTIMQTKEKLHVIRSVIFVTSVYYIAVCFSYSIKMNQNHCCNWRYGICIEYLLRFTEFIAYFHKCSCICLDIQFYHY